MKNVLFISCGSLTATEVNFALRASNEYHIIGSSIYKNHGMYIYKDYITDLPNMSEDGFIDKLNQIIKDYNIKFILSGHESMILFLQENASNINATIVSSCYETALLCRYKSKTYEALCEFDFIPKTFNVKDVTEFPVFIKKDDDQGARHAYRIDNRETLNLYASQDNMIICEYLPGEEVTVDCFTDRHGKLRFCNPRVADRMLAGIDVHARRVLYTKEIQDIAEKINERVKFHGQWFFQIKRDSNGKFKLLEMATRFAGAFGLSLAMDINLPLLALRDFDGKDIEISYNDLPIEADKQFFGRFETPIQYDIVYLDDVEVFHFNGHIDKFFMTFIYQCVDKKKKIAILTKNEDKTKKILLELKISDSLIDEWISDQEGIEYQDNSVFISRNDTTRNRLRKINHMICFDPSSIGTLIDWRG